MPYSPRQTALRSRPSDRVLVERIAEGDELAFWELFARYRSIVYATAYAVLIDPEAVDTVVADTFREARRTAPTFLPTDASVSGWLTHLTRLSLAERSGGAPPKTTRPLYLHSA
jgi:DNA-directed RNA polymerase specialized sigma24 family protein